MSHAQSQWKEVASSQMEPPLFPCPEMKAQLERGLMHGCMSQARWDLTTGQMPVAQATRPDCPVRLSKLTWLWNGKCGILCEWILSVPHMEICLSPPYSGPAWWSLFPSSQSSNRKQVGGRLGWSGCIWVYVFLHGGHAFLSSLSPSVNRVKCLLCRAVEYPAQLSDYPVFK